MKCTAIALQTVSYSVRLTRRLAIGTVWQDGFALLTSISNSPEKGRSQGVCAFSRTVDEQTSEKQNLKVVLDRWIHQRRNTVGSNEETI